jgi:hypothetical protein
MYPSRCNLSPAGFITNQWIGVQVSSRTWVYKKGANFGSARVVGAFAKSLCINHTLRTVILSQTIMSRASRFRVAETSNEPSAMPIMMKGKLEVRGNMTRVNEKEQKKHMFLFGWICFFC